MAGLRPTTNLVIPQHLMLPKADLKKGFMYVYSAAYKGSETAFMTGLWASTLFPSIYNDARWGKTKMRAAAEQLYKRTPSGFLKVRKVLDQANPHFAISVPLMTFMKNSVGGVADFLSSWLLGFAHARKVQEQPEGTQDHVTALQAELSEFVRDVQSEKIISTDKVIQSMHLDSVGAAALKSCLMKVSVKVQGNLVVIFADFKITKDEAQQLTVTEWPTIRNIDIYPLILHWMDSGYGARGTVPLASFSVSSIAFSLPPSHSDSARINELSLSVGPDGKPYYLPKVVDKQQTIAYEDRYTNAGQRDDGSFAFHTMAEGSTLMESGREVQNKLPKNMVVSIDWLNNKYTYTNTEGKLTVEDLTRFQAANVSHLRTLLDKKKITDKEIAWFVQMGEAAGVAQSEFKVTEKDFEGLGQAAAWARMLEGKANDPKGYFDVALKGWFSETGREMCPISEICETGFGPFAPLARYIKRIEGAVKENIETVYLKYSVSTVEMMFPWVVMISHYTDDMTDLRAKDETNRAAAINQGIDPKWKMPSVPLVKDGMGLLPHQLKIENIMKDDPELAILPVQAGGGKSPLLLMDILQRFNADKDAPYLVLCPNHLVPNYVKEAVYFTDGKLNVIAITNVAIRQNGWARLQKIMEAAPRNTVVVVALDTLRYRARTVSYGTEPTIVFPVIDFLRQFNFQYVAIDEAHKIKGKTARNKSVMALLADIPKKRLASGTFAHDSPSDLARIIGALDPTLFGTREEFNTEYGQTVRGDRVIKWKDGAEKKIMDKIRSRIVVAGAMRKEWAAFLPKRVEWIGGVELTPPQQAVYEDILNATIEEIEKDAKTKKQLQKFLNKGKAGGVPTNDELADEEADEDEDEEGSDQKKAADEEEGEDLASMLTPYLARLEQYLIAPGSDPLGKAILKGEDLLSPKVTKCYDRIRLHLFGGEVKNPRTGQQIPYGPFPGKVLVFVNQIEAAEEVFNKAPEDLKKYGILYKASDKVEIISQLENNPNKKWMVGVVQSMEEGLNLQVGARIIRLSSPWNPGSLEQSNSRIERPEFKKADVRQQVFFDTIVADQTYDITKNARLIAKVIASAKFENTDNPEYDEVPNMPVVPMNLETIRTLNSWHYQSKENPGLQEYAQALGKYEQVRNDDYAAYKEAYIARHGSGPVMTLVEAAPTPPDAKLLLRTPYVPGLGLYSEKELGLKRIDEYLNLSPVTDEEEDEAPAGDDEGAYGVSEEDLRKREELTGQPVHTEYGDGVIIKVAPKLRWIRVALPNGYEARLRQSQVFLITRKETSNKDIRKLISRQVGNLPPSVELDVPAEHWVPLKDRYKKLFPEKTKPNTKGLGLVPTTQKQKQANPPVAKKPVDQISVELTIFISNGFLGLDYIMDESNQTAIKVLQAHGFRSTPAYYYARMPDAKRMNIQMKLWKDSGLTMDQVQVKQGVPQAMMEMYRLLQTGQIKNHKETYKATREANVINFYRLEHKASNDKKIFKPYPIIQDGAAYIALPAQGQAGSREAMKYKRASIRWLHSDPSLSYFGTVQQIIHTIKTLREAGVNVANIKELDKEITKLKTMKFVPRVPDDVKAADTGF